MINILLLLIFIAVVVGLFYNINQQKKIEKKLVGINVSVNRNHQTLIEALSMLNVPSSHDVRSIAEQTYKLDLLDEIDTKNQTIVDQLNTIHEELSKIESYSDKLNELNDSISDIRWIAENHANPEILNMKNVK